MDFWQTIGSIAAAALGGGGLVKLFDFLLARRKAGIEEKLVEVQMEAQRLEIKRTADDYIASQFKGIIKRLDGEIKDMREQTHALDVKLATSESEHYRCRSELTECRTELTECRTEIKEMAQRITDLENQSREMP